MTRRDPIRLSRRELLGHAARAALAAPAATALVGLAGCGDAGEAPTPPAAKPSPEPPAATPPSAPSAAAPPPEPAAPAAPAAPPAGDPASLLVTEVPANQGIVSSLQYVNASPEAEKRCANCQLYVAGEGGRGRCPLFPAGLVAEGGYCRSWVPKAG